MAHGSDGALAAVARVERQVWPIVRKGCLVDIVEGSAAAVFDVVVAGEGCAEKFELPGRALGCYFCHDDDDDAVEGVELEKL